MATLEEKKETVDQMVAQLEDAPAIYLTDFTGLTVAETNELRSRFREEGVDYTVCKNTLLEMALERVGGYEGLVEYLHGPTAVAFTEDPAAPAQVMEEFLEENDSEKPSFKAAVVEGDLYDTDEFDTLAALKSKDELIGEIVTLLQSPIRTVVGAVSSQGGRLTALVQSIGEGNGPGADAEDEDE